MLNRITMTGRLTADPELRNTPNGISVTSFSIANQRNYKNSNGDRDTDFYDVTAWRAAAETVTKYFTKGSMITIDGRLESRKYTDKNGNNRTAICIVADNVYFGDSKNSGQNSSAQTASNDFAPDFSVDKTEEDDLPFDAFPPFPG